MLSAISNYISEVIRGKKIRVNGKTAQWKKVSNIKVGQKITVTAADFDRSSDRISQSDVEFDEIVSIKKLGREQVYDVEVEGTHNFVGNGILAHNTYLNLNNNGDIKLVDNASGSVYDGHLDNQYSLQDSLGNAITTAGSFAQASISNLRAGFIQAEKIMTNSLISPIAHISQLFADRLTVREKIVSPVVETTYLVATGTATLNTIATNTIQPQNSDLTIDLSSPIPPISPISPIPPTSPDIGPLARLIIKGLAGKTAAVIDAKGNATFSGTLAAESVISNQLSANNASVSGTLVAGNVEAQNINQLEGNVASQSSSIQNLSSNINDVQKLLADIKNAPLSDTTNSTNISNISNLDQSSSIVNLQSLIVNQLTVSGQSNLYNLSVTGSLLVGTTMIENNGILSLASDLKLSSLGTITLFDGSVVIAKDGTITTQATLIAQGLTIKNSFGEEVASIDASGSAKFNNLAINSLTINNTSTNSAIIAAADNFTQNGIFAPAIQTASASAGIGILPESTNTNPNEVVIYNDNIKKNSLIYITPTSDYPSSNQLTVVKKEYLDAKPYFKVVSATPSITPIKFNWLIIN